LTIFLTSLFSDHKIATEVIGLTFSLSALLPLFYDPEGTGFKHYLAMFMPNSAFSLSIVGNISE